MPTWIALAAMLPTLTTINPILPARAGRASRVGDGATASSSSSTSSIRRVGSRTAFGGRRRPQPEDEPVGHGALRLPPRPWSQRASEPQGGAEGRRRRLMTLRTKRDWCSRAQVAAEWRVSRGWRRKWVAAPRRLREAHQERELRCRIRSVLDGGGGD